MPRPADWKSDGPTRKERNRHLSWSHYRDIGIHGHPEAVAYKINKKAMGLA